MKIVHFTTVHPRDDVRVYVKEGVSLASRYDQVCLVVADGKGDEQGVVPIIDIGQRARSRVIRMTWDALRMGLAVSRLRPGIAHFHDPELMVVGLLLSFTGTRVVYDVHENMPLQVLSKPWIPRWLRPVVSRGAALLERICVTRFAGVAAATPSIGQRFPAAKAAVVQNFPLKAELCVIADDDYHARPSSVAYVGGLTVQRGAWEMIAAIGRLEGIRLEFAGGIRPAALRQELEGHEAWRQVRDWGWVDRECTRKLLSGVRAGLVLFHPSPNHVTSQPNKLFEYMAAGLPVIASDFPLWRRLVDEVGCGLLVDPMDVGQVSGAVRWIIDHPAKAVEMGRRGRQAVLEKFCWEREVNALYSLYERVLH